MYFAIRSVRDNEPVLICPAFVANEFERSERTIQYDIEYIEFMKEALQLQIQRSISWFNMSKHCFKSQSTAIL
ncbi:hypothetical protein CYJ03_009085 [Staphylococcus pseudintermedius]|nr:hypothetical protein CYJ03_009085 [Staphylococcus pseudintermedius]